MIDPKISIIIPCLNECKNITTLAAFFNQLDKNQNYEVIVVDSYESADNVESICVQNQLIYQKHATTSRASQMNAGAKIATGNIYCFLHADVIPPISFLNNIRHAVQNGFSFGLFAYRFFPTSFLLNVNARFTFKKGLFVGGGDQIHFMTEALYHQLGGYNETQIIMEDFALMDKIKKQKIPYTIIQQPATVSSRKYTHNSWLKVNVLNAAAFIMFKCNAAPEKIKKLYYSGLK